MVKMKFLTHSLRLENLSYVIDKQAVVPKRRYSHLKFKIFGLSLNGAYAAMSSGYVAHIVFPAKIIKKYSVKPVIYTHHEITRTMIPSRDKAVYYYSQRFAFEMELVSESVIPIYEAEAVYVSRYAIRNDIIEKLFSFCREHGITIEDGIPADQETKEVAVKMLKGDSKTIDEYNKAICQYFNIDCRVPSEQELKELLIYWRGW